MNWSDVMVPTPMARERLSALRETISRLENEPVPGIVKAARKAATAGFSQRQPASWPERAYLPLGVAEVDRILEGGLPLAGLTEIRAQQTRDAGAGAGLVLALAALCQNVQREQRLVAPVLWIGQPLAIAEAGLPYAIGLQAYGVDISRFVFASPRTLEDALWIAETALSVSAFTTVILEMRGNPAGFGLSESRRLHLRARAGGLPLLLLRQAGEEEASSALFRLHVSPAPALARCLPDGAMLAGSLGNPVFHVTVEKSRILSSTGILMEWNAHDRRFRHIEPDAIAIRAGTPYPVSQLPLSSRRPGGAKPMGELVAFQRAS